jgi:hypothetical protein
MIKAPSMPPFTRRITVSLSVHAYVPFTDMTIAHRVFVLFTGCSNKYRWWAP